MCHTRQLLQKDPLCNVPVPTVGMASHQRRRGPQAAEGPATYLMPCQLHLPFQLQACDAMSPLPSVKLCCNLHLPMLLLLHAAGDFQQGPTQCCPGATPSTGGPLCSPACPRFPFSGSTRSSASFAVWAGHHAQQLGNGWGSSGGQMCTGWTAVMNPYP